jgi:hypothetical protein
MESDIDRCGSRANMHMHSAHVVTKLLLIRALTRKQHTLFDCSVSIYKSLARVRMFEYLKLARRPDRETQSLLTANLLKLASVVRMSLRVARKACIHTNHPPSQTQVHTKSRNSARTAARSTSWLGQILFFLPPVAATADADDDDAQSPPSQRAVIIAAWDTWRTVELNGVDG